MKHLVVLLNKKNNLTLLSFLKGGVFESNVLLLKWNDYERRKE
jgi:hypothetical protein